MLCGQLWRVTFNPRTSEPCSAKQPHNNTGSDVLARTCAQLHRDSQRVCEILQLSLHPSPPRKPQHTALRGSAAVFYSPTRTLLLAPFFELFLEQSNSSERTLRLQATKSMSQCMFCNLGNVHELYKYGAFLFVPIFSFGEAGDRSLSRGKPFSLTPPLAHQHVSINHLHIFIIHLPQVMNYSTHRFPHGNSELRHKGSLAVVFTLLLTPSSSCLCSLLLSLPLSCTIGRK